MDLPLKVSVSGVRGIWGGSLTPETILQYSRAFVHFIKNTSTSTHSPINIVIGSDTRPTSPVFKAMVASFLQTYGVHIIDLGYVPTPILLFGVRYFKAHGGIVFTASHNPLEWNAFKYITQEGLFLNNAQMQDLEFLAKKNKVIPFSYHHIGTIKYSENIISHYIQTLLPYFNISAIKNSGLSITADVINGTASIFLPALMEYLNLHYKMIHTDTDKAFERGAEPKPENLLALQEALKQNHSDIGLAFDPDGDRLALVDNEGNIMGENWTLVIAYLCFLELHNPKNKNIVINLSTSLLIDQVANRFNSSVIRTPVGEINVTKILLKNNIPLGGEGNGGVIFPHLNPCRDSIIAILFILEYLAVKQITLSSLYNQFKIPFSISQAIKIKNSISSSTLAIIGQDIILQFNLTAPSTDIQDGIRIAYKEGWIQIRASNTEPIIRIMGEAYNQKLMIDIAEYIQEYLNGL